MIFFDYVYYKSCKWYYSYKYSRNEYKPSGLILTCTYVGLNVAQMVILSEYLLGIKLLDSKYEILYYVCPVILPFIVSFPFFVTNVNLSIFNYYSSLIQIV